MRDSILRRAAAVVVAVCVGITFVPLAGEYDVFATEEAPSVVAQDVPSEDSDQSESTETGNDNGTDTSGTPVDNGNEPSGTQTPGTENGEADGNDSGNGDTQDPPTEPKVKNDLLEEDGNWYYYENNVRKPGLITTEEGKVYYADPDTCIIQSGMKAIDGKYYYFAPNTFERQSGLKTINGSLYYFDPATFAMRTGAVNVNGALYYFFKDGKATTATSWFKGDDSSTADRFGLGGGKIQTGVRAFTSTVSYKAKVKKRYKKKRKWRTKYVTVTKTKNVTTRYFFDKTTGRLKPAGFFKDGSNQYYSYGGGKLATGWTILDNKAYYFNASTGVQAINTTVGYLKIPASGYLGEAYVLGIKKLNSTGWSLKQAYKNSYKIKYQGRWWRQKTSEQYALKGFKYNKGNCYVMAATFYIQAKLLGYNVRQIHGKVAHRAPHSWTQIKTGGKWKVYDPNFKNETRRNGWNIYYGKKGTWRYTDYSTFQN